MRILKIALFCLMMLPALAHAEGLEIEKVSTLEMPEGLPTAGVFFIVNNDGPADKLVAAKTEIAEQTMIHVTDVDEKTGALVMRHADALDVPANGTLAMAPGANHVMLIGVKKQLKKGDSFPMTLIFEKAGEKQVTVDVIAHSKMSDLFPAELSNEVIDKMVSVKKSLGQTDDKRSGWDTLREKIQNLFRKDAGKAADGPLPSREEMENSMKLESTVQEGVTPAPAAAPTEPAAASPEQAPVSETAPAPESVPAPESAPAPAEPAADDAHAHH